MLASDSSARLPLIDELRGIAFVMMVIFHFCYDLGFFVIARVPLYQHWFWIGFRDVILFLFLGLVGVCLSLNHDVGFSWQRYGKRLGRLIAAAAIISIATFFAVQGFWVFFGIIHMIAASLIFALPFVFWGKRYRYAIALFGAALFIIGSLYPLDLPVWLVWLWHAEQSPPTVDYVPLVPWFGFTLIGLAFGWQAQLWAKTSIGYWFGQNIVSRGIVIALQWCGRHALVLYLIHQPILWAGFFLFLMLR